MAVVKRTLTFLEEGSWPPHERPYELLFKPPDNTIPVANYNAVEVQGVPIHDLRASAQLPSLDHEGFFVANLNSDMKYEDYFDQDKLKNIYMPEIKAFLKAELGVRAAYIHECVIRQSDGDGGHSGKFGRPIPNVHTDYTHNYALQLIEQLTASKTHAELIKKSRLQMLKFVLSFVFLRIWKPLRGPVQSWPLALCDLQTLDRDDTIEFDEVHIGAVLESQQIVYNASQKWYYLSNQAPTEMLIFKSMDTVERGEVAHGSFPEPADAGKVLPRESIELRVLVAY